MDPHPLTPQAPPPAPQMHEVAMPHLRRRHPLRRSCHYSPALADEVDTWYLSFGPLTSPRQQDMFRRTDHTYLAAVCWPAADQRALSDLSRLAAAMMGRDHDIDCATPSQARNAAHAFLAETRNHYVPHPCGDPRWAPLFTDLWQRLSAHRPRSFLTRLADAIAAYLSGCLTWLDSAHDCAPPHTLDAYLATRRTTIAQRIDHLLIEMSLEIELSSTVLEHPLMERLHAADVERTILVQDLLSAPRELAAGETENLLAVLAAEHHRTPAEVLPQAMNLYEHAQDTYDQVHAEIRHTALAQQPHIRAYLTALNDFNTGLIEWTSHSPRYTRTLTAQWSTPDQIVHSHPAAPNPAFRPSAPAVWRRP